MRHADYGVSQIYLTSQDPRLLIIHQPRGFLGVFKSKSVNQKMIAVTKAWTLGIF